MGKKRSLFTVFFIIFSVACFAQNATTKELVVGDVKHVISLEQAKNESATLLATDIMTTADKTIPSLGVSILMTTTHILKSLTLTLECDSSFTVSAELQWIFSGMNKAFMYGTVETKRNPDGNKVTSISFLSDLDAFREDIKLAAGSSGVMRLYSNKGKYVDYIIPADFLKLLV
jgi:hypothetical protein